MSDIDHVISTIRNMDGWSESIRDSLIQTIKQLTDENQQLKDQLSKYREALTEIAEWPRNPEGPNYSQKYIAQQALSQLKE